MTDRIKELLLSESLEDNWLAVEILRKWGRTEEGISYLICRVIKGDFNRFMRFFKVTKKHGEKEDIILRRDINDY